MMGKVGFFWVSNLFFIEILAEFNKVLFAKLDQQAKRKLRFP